ncbi:MAG: hypothetical protein NTX49_06345 [Chlamydiae bacterium]|nr:hypothetical protein [Chlamydiota bacterium]
MSEPLLRLSTQEKEGMYHASKWLKHQILIDEVGMKELFESIGKCYICHASGPVQSANTFISKEKILEVYASYIQAIKQGQPIDEKELRRFFCNYLTYDLDSLYGVPISQDRCLIKVARPVVQMQFHHFFPSTVDGKFHSMVMTEDSVHWGVQFSYPQIFEDPKTHQYFKMNESPDFPNTALFKNVIRYIRSHTVPTPFIFQGVRTRVPFRLGKSCFSWINTHKELKEKGIVVEV